MVLAGLGAMLVILIAYVWMTRGFFSAFLHMLCTIAAGGVAFAAWEPLAYAMLPQGGVIENSAWSIALWIPFALVLLPIRLAIDKIIPANVKLVPAVDYIGGALCGAVSGVITAGIVILSMGMMRLETDFMGYRALEYSSTGSVVRTGGLMAPVDRAVEELYKFTSTRAFSVDTPLATLYPNLSEVPTSMRMSFGEGNNRNTIKAEDFELVGRYTVAYGKSLPVTELLKDAWNPAPQQAKDGDRNDPQKGSYLDSYVLKFKAGAKDKGDGKVVIGGAQVRLVVRDAEGIEFLTLYPVASICQADSATPRLARFRFDGRDVFFASAGSAAESLFSFEFVVPDTYSPVALYVKNVRTMIEDEDGVPMKPEIGQFASPPERDSAVSSNRFIKGTGGGAVVDQTPLDTSKEIKIGDGRQPPSGQLPQITGMNVNNRMQRNIQKGTEMGLVIDDKNIIIDGRTKITNEVITKAQGVDKALRIDRFANSSDTLIIQLDVNQNMPFSIIGPVAAQVDQKYPPVLRDTENTQYLPVGWIYSDSELTDIRYTPGSPITSVEELGREKVGLSRSRTDQKLTLIYSVSRGVTINRFTIGPTSICLFDPNVPMTAEQR